MSLALAVSGSTAAATTAPDDSAWYLIFARDGAPIGHVVHEDMSGPDGRRIVDVHKIDLIEQHHGPLHLSRRTEVRQKDGVTTGISDESRDGGTWVRSEARIGAGEAEIVRSSPSDRRTVRVALPAGVRFDDGDDLLPGWNPLGAPLEFPNFNIGAMAVEHVVIERLDAAPDREGRIAVARRRYDGDALRGVARLVLDRNGNIVSASQTLLGGTITLRAVDRDTALQKRPLRTVPLDLSITSPFRISSAASHGHIRYRFTFVDGLAFGFPVTGEQRATPVDGGTTIDICETCGPGMPDTAEALADARKPTPWLQSDSAMIRAIAMPVARLRLSDAGKMKLLAKRAREHLKRVEVSGHYSALDALKRGAGDCTEDAVVLAALGRAAGIPTRVANGLVYARQRFHGTSNTFLPHSWTLAWADGAWRSFDLSLGDFDATHIALTVGDGDARSVMAANQLAGLLRWDAMNEIRPRPAS
jgi:hypothetical protein